MSGRKGDVGKQPSIPPGTKKRRKTSCFYLKKKALGGEVLSQAQTWPLEMPCKGRVDKEKQTTVRDGVSNERRRRPRDHPTPGEKKKHFSFQEKGNLAHAKNLRV